MLTTSYTNNKSLNKTIRLFKSVFHLSVFYESLKSEKQMLMCFLLVVKLNFKLSSFVLCVV